MPYRCEKYHTCYHHRSASFCSLDLHTIYHDSLCTCRSVRCEKTLLSIHSKKVAFSARCPGSMSTSGYEIMAVSLKTPEAEKKKRKAVK